MKWIGAFAFLLFPVFVYSHKMSPRKLARLDPRQFLIQYNIRYTDHQQWLEIDYSYGHSRLNQIAREQYVKSGKKIIVLINYDLYGFDESKFDVYELPRISHLITETNDFLYEQLNDHNHCRVFEETLDRKKVRKQKAKLRHELRKSLTNQQAQEH